jgi:sulfur carrier protein ThiS
MKITLTYNGVMDIKAYKRGSELEVEEGTTPSDVMDLCGIEARHKQYILPFINGDEVRSDAVLQDGDELSLFLPLGGG